MKLTPLKLRRLERGMLQIDLATKARLPRTRLCELENGHMVPRREELERIAGALEIPLEALLHR